MCKYLVNNDLWTSVLFVFLLLYTEGNMTLWFYFLLASLLVSLCLLFIIVSEDVEYLSSFGVERKGSSRVSWVVMLASSISRSTFCWRTCSILLSYLFAFYFSWMEKWTSRSNCALCFVGRGCRWMEISKIEELCVFLWEVGRRKLIYYHFVMLIN